LRDVRTVSMTALRARTKPAADDLVAGGVLERLSND